MNVSVECGDYLTRSTGVRATSAKIITNVKVLYNSRRWVDGVCSAVQVIRW